MNGQLSIFELFDQANNDSVDWNQIFLQTDYNSYLNRGENKITSLKRRVKTLEEIRSKKGIIPNIFDIRYKDLGDDISSTNALDYYFDKLSKYIWLKLKNCKTESDFYILTEQLFNNCFNVKIKFVGNDSEESQLLNLCLKSKKDKNAKDNLYVKITISDSSNIYLNFISCLNKPIKKCIDGTIRLYRRGRHKSDCYYIRDIGKTLAEFSILYAIKKFANVNNKQITFLLLKKYFLIDQNNSDHKKYIKLLTDKFNLNIKGDKYYFLLLPSYLNDSENVKLLNSLNIEVLFTDKKITDNSIPQKYYLPLSNEYSKYILDSIFTNDFYTLNNIYKGGSSNNEDFKKDFFIIHPDILVIMFKLILDENENSKEKVKYLNNIESSYAASYETKKNIPLKIQKAMKYSLFNNFFGYVEFDELVDLEKIEEIEKEFIAFSNLFDEIKSHKDHSIRFRRLGKHKAAGLYFSGFQALCIDINYPYSLIHEYGHMLDYTNNELSDQASFLPVYTRYKQVLTTTVSKLALEDNFRQKWEGNSKYNRNYYLQNTEVFARCFEIYIRIILQVDNSLCGNCKSIVYPSDKLILKLIGDYFNNILTLKEEPLKAIQ
ncbi:hypothetical protein [Vallitalea guaymasensis]|uniref:hypothetical protein n=1 Tax=Vallitalea guaymasensis TaxID=1185412 RepID=UPI000DE2F33D|nr:hypothetical protein [Vallitalea guaymasensis]